MADQLKSDEIKVLLSAAEAVGRDTNWVIDDGNDDSKPRDGYVNLSVVKPDGRYSWVGLAEIADDCEEPQDTARAKDFQKYISGVAPNVVVKALEELVLIREKNALLNNAVVTLSQWTGTAKKAREFAAETLKTTQGEDWKADLESAEGERCWCGASAHRKVGEELPVGSTEHGFTAYVCDTHFAQMMGPVAAKSVGVDLRNVDLSQLYPWHNLTVEEREFLAVELAGTFGHEINPEGTLNQLAEYEDGPSGTGLDHFLKNAGEVYEWVRIILGETQKYVTVPSEEDRRVISIPLIHAAASSVTTLMEECGLVEKGTIKARLTPILEDRDGEEQ